MGTNIRVSVYQGDRLELLPPICMFCGRPVAEEHFQPMQAQIGGAVHALAFPICVMCKLPDQVLQPDGSNVAIPGLNPQRYQPYLAATFGFQDVTPKFAEELDRLRNIRHDLYDPQFAQSNARIQAAVQGPSDVELAEAEQQRQQTEATEAEDEAAFQLEQAAGTSEVSGATAKESSRKLIFISVIAGAIGLILVSCITVGIIGYSIYTKQQAAAENKAKNEAPPPKELRAKIKVVDKDAHTIRILGSDNRHQTFKINDRTEFRDREGNLLPQGLSDPKIHEEEYCVILPTQDRQSLQWLKLTPPPK